MDGSLTLLIATDNHLGFAEKDPVRGNDSFETFEEILQLAHARNVDAVLLGGDLFHENKPSRKTLHRCLELLRQHCLGSRPCQLELLSDPAASFSTRQVNYEDPNLNVAMPVFAIHGNHDDPAGDGNLSALDLLATAGLVNYFGKTPSVDDISLVPILLRKGTTQLALYGLGAVRDERLHRTFLQRRVRLVRPDTDGWFSLLVLHQNRAAHGPSGYIPESFLDESLDLVVWGHEHECRADEPSHCAQRGFVVCQPGSSVATSLCEGESRKKQVVVLRVSGKTFETEPVPLRTVRPFVMMDVGLRQAVPAIDPADAKAVNAYLCKRVESVLGDGPLPLVRLRVDSAVVNPQRFGQQFVGRVANPRDLVHIVRQRGRVSRDAAREVEISANAVAVEDLVSQFLGDQQLDLFPQNEFSDAVRIAVEKDERDVIEGFIKGSLARVVRSLTEKREGVLERTALKDEFGRTKKQREEEWDRLHPGLIGAPRTHDQGAAAKPKQQRLAFHGAAYTDI